MALIIYPTADYDSFITVADATTAIGELTLHSTQWTALTNAEKEVYLRIAFRNIDDHVDQDDYPYPDPMTDCVGTSQALMAVQDVVYGFSASTSTAEVGSVKKEKVASLEIEYYDSKSNTMKYAQIVPDMAKPCLETLGYIFTPTYNGLSQSTLGRS